MRHSRIVRMSILVLFLGIGLCGVMMLPALFSQEDARPAAPATFQPPPSVPMGAPPMGGGAPAGLPSAGFGVLPDAGAAAPAGGGAPPGLAGAAGEFPVSENEFGGESFVPPSGAPAAGASSGKPPAGAGSMMGMMMGGMSVRGGPQGEEIRLAGIAKSLLGAYAREANPEVKEKLKSNLRSVLHQQFRLQHQRRDTELARIEKRLADLRTRLKKRSDAQSTIVDRRLEQLVNDIDGLGWNAEEIPDNLFNEDMGGPMMMPGMGGMGGGMGMGPGGGRGGRGGPGMGVFGRGGRGPSTIGGGGLGGPLPAGGPGGKSPDSIDGESGTAVDQGPSANPFAPPPPGGAAPGGGLPTATDPAAPAVEPVAPSGTPGAPPTSAVPGAAPATPATPAGGAAPATPSSENPAPVIPPAGPST